MPIALTDLVVGQVVYLVSGPYSLPHGVCTIVKLSSSGGEVHINMPFYGWGEFPPYPPTRTLAGGRGF